MMSRCPTTMMLAWSTPGRYSAAAVVSAHNAPGSEPASSCMVRINWAMGEVNPCFGARVVARYLR